jgi:mercuric reductase
MTPKIRKIALTAHIASSVGWFGAVAGFEALANAGLLSSDAFTMRAAYLAMEKVTWLAIVPFAFISLVTGLIIALGTKWGLFRHYIGIEKTGVKLGKEAQILVDEFLRTSVPHIFAAGDVIGHELGNQLATPVGSQDGGIAAENAFADGPLRPIDHRVVPRSIFTDPQIATVGLTEEEAISAGYNCWRNSVAISLVPRAIAIRNPLGIVKMVADANTDEVIGVSMVGDSAGEVIHEAAMGLRFRAKVSDFIEQLHVCPTMAEALKIVAISRRKDPSKLSCCAE